MRQATSRRNATFMPDSGKYWADGMTRVRTWPSGSPSPASVETASMSGTPRQSPMLTCTSRRTPALRYGRPRTRIPGTELCQAGVR